jgi:acetyl esterase/lipase
VIAYGWENPILVEGEEYVRRLREDGVAATISLYPNPVHGLFLLAGTSHRRKKCIDEVATTVKNAAAHKALFRDTCELFANRPLRSRRFLAF